MGRLGENIKVPFQTDLQCPICEERLDVQVVVELHDGSSQKAGSRGFRDPIITVHMNTKPVMAIIEHECMIKSKED